ncbi:hypothetical protein DFQ14_101401 [Halopolyspora algeriensis]|uniref:PRC-barrel domain protein n=1 Tax=Halopolyspora algeriensis TaxID=1500506 RepID=A0A368VYJ4_9ACTN|nr:PRC-barrel domain containing protein [Halopolyspora algeriensis]RCW47057.1 hypothetical protein DFQ14_101401 [Halopolyspora algeriensis]TQM48144.1 hypothetical protein FHU43_3106 [Halopolyspora algeriensis]
MVGQREALRLFGCGAFDPWGHRLGIVGQIFLDAETEQPAWIVVQSGLFGTNERFVPLEGAAFDGDTLTVAVHREAVRRAPHVPLDQGDLPLEEVQALYRHYGIEPGGGPAEIRDGESGTGSKYADSFLLRLRRRVAAT